MKQITYKSLALAFSCAIFLLSFMSCKKTEFLPEPEGTKVPYKDDATQTVEQLLAASPAKLFFTAWQKSNLPAQLKENGKNTQFTLLVPSDAALNAAGISATVISQMPVKELDSLVMFYTSIGKVNKESLNSTSLMVKTLLEHKGLRVKYFDSKLDNQQQYDPYFYKQYLAIKGDELLANGKSMGKLNYLPATNGAVYLLEKVIQRPDKTLAEVLKADGRFNTYLELLRQTDEQYLEIMITQLEPLFGYRMSVEEYKDNFSGRRMFFGDEWGGINRPPYASYNGPNITVSTYFAPTDDAFKKAGFQSITAIMKFNERNNVRFDDNTFEPSGSFATDSILTYHQDWGRMFATKDPSYGINAPNNTVFFSNDLVPALNDYYVNTGGTANAIYSYKNPIRFTTGANGVELQVKESSFEPAHVVETDLNSLNGPIHVVEHLLIPKGFKLN